jgi:hypothetical protein
MYTIDDFKKGDMFIVFEKENRKEHVWQFVKLCEQYGIKWVSGEDATNLDDTKWPPEKIHRIGYDNGSPPRGIFLRQDEDDDSDEKFRGTGMDYKWVAFEEFMGIIQPIKFNEEEFCNLIN